jgi:amino-acid N-acetyltransferase
MQHLVKPYVEEGTILVRSDDEVANAIRSYALAKEKEEILGFASLFIYTRELAEVRSLAVAKKHQRNGIGGAIVRALIEEGRKLGLRQILTLTYHSAFFKKLGFQEVAKEEVWHHKVWEDCIKCRHFPVCDESALILNL